MEVFLIVIATVVVVGVVAYNYPTLFNKILGKGADVINKVEDEVKKKF